MDISTSTENGALGSSSMRDGGAETVVVGNHHHEVAKPTTGVSNDSISGGSNSRSDSWSSSSVRPFSWSQSDDSGADIVSQVSSPGCLTGLGSCGDSLSCNTCSKKNSITATTTSEFDVVMDYYCDLETWSRQAEQTAEEAPFAMEVELDFGLALPHESADSISSWNPICDSYFALEKQQSKLSLRRGPQQEDAPPQLAGDQARQRCSGSLLGDNIISSNSSGISNTFKLPLSEPTRDPSALKGAAPSPLTSQSSFFVTDSSEGSSSTQNNRSRTTPAEDCFITAPCRQQQQQTPHRRASTASDAQLSSVGTHPAAAMAEARPAGGGGDPGPAAADHQQQHLQGTEYRQYDALHGPHLQYASVSGPYSSSHAVPAGYGPAAFAWQPQQVTAQTSYADVERSNQLRQSNQPPGVDEQGGLRPQYTSPISPYAQLQQSLHEFQQHYFTATPQADIVLSQGTSAPPHGINTSDHRLRPTSSVSDTSASSSHRSTPGSGVSVHSATVDLSQNHPSSAAGEGDWQSSVIQPIPSASQHQQQQIQNEQQYSYASYENVHISHQRQQPQSYIQQDLRSEFSQPTAWQSLPNKYSGFDPDQQNGVSSFSTTAPQSDLYKGNRPAGTSPSPYQVSSYWHPHTQAQLRDRQGGLPALSLQTSSAGIAPSSMSMSQDVDCSPSSASSANVGNMEPPWALYREAPNQELRSPYSASPSMSDIRFRSLSLGDSHVRAANTQSSDVGLPHQHAALASKTSDNGSSENIANPTPLAAYTHTSFHHTAPVAGGFVNGTSLSRSYDHSVQSMPNIPQPSLDFTFENLPLHFDYSQPGNPRPIERPMAPSKRSHSKKRPTITSSNNSSGSSKVSDTSRGAPAPTPSLHQGQASFDNSNASDSSDSGGSSYFSKGQKRRRPELRPTPGSTTGSSSTSGVSSIASNQSGHNLHGDGLHESDVAGSYRSHGALTFVHAPEAPVQFLNYQDTIPQIAALHLDSRPSLSERTSDPYSASAQSEPPSPASIGSSESLSSMDSIPLDGVDGETNRAAAALPQRATNGRRLYECKVCSRKFPRPSALIVHERIHSGEKPFVCEFCDRPFTVASNLRRHQKIHAKESTKQSEERTKDKAGQQSQSSDGSTVKGRRASRARLNGNSEEDDIDPLQEASKSSQAAGSDFRHGSTAMSTVSDGSEAFSYDERSQDGSSMTNHFNLPEIHVKDFASGPSQSGSLTGAEQQTAEQSELERIRQWSSQVA